MKRPTVNEAPNKMHNDPTKKCVIYATTYIKHKLDSNKSRSKELSIGAPKA